MPVRSGILAGEDVMGSLGGDIGVCRSEERQSLGQVFIGYLYGSHGTMA